MREERFKAALAALSDPRMTAIVLVTRPEKSAIAEAARTSTEFRALGLFNQRLVANGVFHAALDGDPIAQSLEQTGQQALSDMPELLRLLPRDDVPLRSVRHGRVEGAEDHAQILDVRWRASRIH